MFLFFISAVLSAQIKEPKLSFLDGNLGSYSYTMTTDDVHKYPRFIGAFDVQLYSKKGGPANFSEYQLTNDNAICKFDQRRTTITPAIAVQLNNQRHSFYTDIVNVPDTNFSFLIRSDLKIFKVTHLKDQLNNLIDIQVDQNAIDFSKHVVQDYPSKSYGFVEKNILFIISEWGAVSYNIETGQIKNIQMEKRKKIYKVYYKWYQIYVVAGEEGIDVYAPRENNLILTQIIKLQKQLNFVDMAFNKYQYQKLYLLDDKQGVWIVDITTGQIQQDLLPVENAIAFTYHQGSFLVAAKTPDGDSFAVEILYNFDTQEYYYNEFFLDDLDIRDIFKIDDRAILIGSDAQVLVYQNIYHGNQFKIEGGFTDDNFDKDFILEVPNVQHMQLSQNYLWVLSNWELKAFNFYETQPQVTCQSEVESSESYWVKINSTVCKKKVSLNPFQLCQLDFQFSLDIYSPLVTSEEQLEAAVFSIALVIIFLNIILIAIFCIRKWNKILNAMESKKEKVQNRIKYASMEMSA